MCCTRLAENTGRKNRHFGTIGNFVGLYLRSWSMYRQSEKNLLNNDTSSTCPHNMVNFRLLTAEIRWRVWGTPANFNGFCVLAALLHGTLVVSVSQTLHDVWPSPALGTPYIHFRGLLPADGILPGAKFTLHPSLAFFYIGRATITLDTGPHYWFHMFQNWHQIIFYDMSWMCPVLYGIVHVVKWSVTVIYHIKEKYS